MNFLNHLMVYFILYLNLILQVLYQVKIINIYLFNYKLSNYLKIFLDYLDFVNLVDNLLIIITRIFFYFLYLFNLIMIFIMIFIMNFIMNFIINLIIF